MRITVIGTGYVGLVTGACLADMGNDVTCVDNAAEKIASLRQGVIPIYEPGLQDLVARNSGEKRLSFTTRIEEAVDRVQVCFIAVGTPPDDEGGADKTYVLQAVTDLANAVTGPCVLAVKSTVPVGTCDQIQDTVTGILVRRGVDFGVDVVSNPEFLKEGKAIEDFIRPDRIVVGARSEAADAVMRDLYSHFIRNGHTYLALSVRSSEMSKYAANAMLATRISLMNEIAQICDRIGADVMEVRRGVGSDKRIGMDFLYPGVGYGGSCFPKDVAALSRLALESDCAADILEAVQKVNRHQKLSIANRVIQYHGGDLKDRRLALWGLAFKPKTDDLREAPSLTIVRRLTSAGAHVCAFDPAAIDNARKALAPLVSAGQVTFAADMYEVLHNADGLILATEWAQFRKPDFQRIHAALRVPVIFDGRNLYEPEVISKLGFDYHCVGRGGRNG